MTGSEQKIFYAATVNGSETYTFWTRTIEINLDLEIDDLAQALVVEYAQSHQAFSVDIYKVVVYIFSYHVPKTDSL